MPKKKQELKNLKEEVVLRKITDNKSSIADGYVDDRTIAFKGRKSATDGFSDLFTINLTIKGDPKHLANLMSELNLEKLDEKIIMELHTNPHTRLD
jgi:hypothetical protein